MNRVAAALIHGAPMHHNGLHTSRITRALHMPSSCRIIPLATCVACVAALALFTTATAMAEAASNTTALGSTLISAISNAKNVIAAKIVQPNAQQNVQSNKKTHNQGNDDKSLRKHSADNEYTQQIKFNLSVYGDDKSVNYTAAKVMCLNVNYELKKDYDNCSASFSTEYDDVVQSLKTATSNIIIVPSTVEKDVLNGTNEFKNQGPYDKLRFLFSLQTVPTVVIVKKSSNIKVLDALENKSLDIGQDYNNRHLFNEWIAFYNKDTSFFSHISESDVRAQMVNLCSGTSTAVIISAEQPNDVMSKIASICDVDILGLKDKIVASHNEYTTGIISAGEYMGNPFEISTIGSKATVLSSSDVSEEEIYKFTKIIMTNLDTIKQAHPSLNGLTIDSMLKDAKIAPLHDGVLRYLREIHYDMAKLDTPSPNSTTTTTTPTTAATINTTQQSIQQQIATKMPH